MKKLLLLLGCFITMARLFAFTPSPYTEGLGFSCKLTGGTGGGATLTIYGDTTASVGSSTNAGESPVSIGWLRPGKSYTVTYAGTLVGYSGNGTSGSYMLSFTSPSGYALFIDGTERDLLSVSLSSGANQLPFSHSYSLELRPVFGTARMDAGSFSGIDVGKSVTWEIGLGGLRAGQAAGRISFREKDLSTSPASRDRLYYTAPANAGQITVVRDGASNQTLRQISVPQTVVDLVDDTGPSGGYWLKFYAPAQANWNGSLYTFAGQTPWRTLRVLSPAANQLSLTETEGSAARVSSLALTSGTIASGTYLWTLQEGDGATWLRTTTHASTNNGNGTRDDLITVRTGGSGGTVVAQTKYRFTSMLWGEEVTQIVADPNSAALTTTYTYHSTNTAYGNYRKVKDVTGATGNWTSYAYYDDWNRRGRLALQTQPYVATPATAQAANLSVGNSVSYDYSSDLTNRYTIETSQQNMIGNVATGSQLTTRTLNLVQNGLTFTRHQVNDYSAAGVAVQTSSEITDAVNSNFDQRELTLSVKRPDQSQDSYAYYRGTYSGTTFTVLGSGDYFRTNVWHGSTNAAGATAFTNYDGATVSTVYLLANKSTMDVVIRNPAGLPVRQETHVYTGGTSFALLSAQDFTYSAAGRLTQSLGSNGATTSYSYVNGLLDSTTDATGVTSAFTYDQLWRVASQRKVGALASGGYAAQGDIYSYFTYDGANRVVESVTTNSSTKPAWPGGALDLFATASYDLAGRVTQQVANAGASNPTHRLTTGFAYNVAARTTTVTLPGGATKISTANLDGSLQSVSGTAVLAATYTYWIDGSGNKARQSTYGGISSAVNSYQDWLGRPVAEWSIGGDGNWVNKAWYYNSAGQLWKSTQPGAAATLYEYDTLGRQSAQGLDVNANDTLDRASDDRITAQDSYIHTWDSGVTWWLGRTNTIFSVSGSWANPITSQSNEMLAGFPSGRLAWKLTNDIFGNTTGVSVDVDRANKKTTTTTDTPDSNINAVQIAYNGLGVESTDTTGVNMKYGFDAVGRLTQSTDPRTGTTTTAYIAGTSMVDWVKDPSNPANVTQASYTYDAAGRVQSVKNALNKYTYYDYTARNEKYREWGDTTYPIEYVFDALGRQTQMKTYAASTANFTGSTWPGSPGTPNVTTWNYHPTTGLLSSKTDAANQSVSFTYTPARQLATRTWARGTVTNYAYSSTTAELTGITYSDGTPAVSFTYNRLGQSSTVNDYTGTRTFNYNLGGTLELQNEQLGSFYGTFRITRDYDTTAGTAGRYKRLSVGPSSNPYASYSMEYGYDSSGRLNKSWEFPYTYVPKSNLIASVSDTGSNWTQSRTYLDNRDQLDIIETKWAATSKAKFDYEQDGLGRAKAVARTGEIFNRYGNGTQGLDVNYGYNDRSEVTSEQTKLGGTNTLLAGRDDSYAFDQLGNRKTTTHNGNTASYTTNTLNQYSQRTVPPLFDVAGATPGSTVTVSKPGGPTDTAVRHGEYFFDPYAMPNSAATAFAKLQVSDGATKVGEAALGLVGPEWSIAAAADFNADGKPDILWQNTTTGERFVWFMNGTSIAGGVSVATLATEWSIAAAADFNADGQPDILWQNTTTGERFVWFMNGTAIAGGVSLGTVATGWTIVAAADFNSDGKADILWHNNYTGQTSIWLMNGTSVQSAVDLQTVPVGWTIATAADFNGDVKTDLLWQNRYTGQSSVWFMNGTSLQSTQDLPNVAVEWASVAAADFNGNAQPDIVWQNTTTGERKVWFMTGSTAQMTSFVAATPEVITYDLDGNLLTDGRYNYYYDAENRLISVQTSGAAVAAGVPQTASNFSYDYLGRRIAKTNYLWSGGGWALQSQRRYLYDGWNLLFELDPNMNALAMHVWGLDNSGTLQGAGGVGGLLASLDCASGFWYSPAYDGNGNVMAMIKRLDGTVAAAYEYDAFGNTIRESGPYAASNPFRSATKYTDTETGLVYYGKRFYSPSLGRFVNRDPIEEAGGVNLYGFCGNNGVNGYDLLGMETFSWFGVEQPGWSREQYETNLNYRLRYDNTSALRAAREYYTPYGYGDTSGGWVAVFKHSQEYNAALDRFGIPTDWYDSADGGGRKTADGSHHTPRYPQPENRDIVVTDIPVEGAPAGTTFTASDGISTRYFNLDPDSTLANGPTQGQLAYAKEWTNRLKTGKAPDWASDPYVKKEMQKAWEESKPGAPTSDQREQGGWVVQQQKTFSNLWGLIGPEYTVERWPAIDPSKIDVTPRPAYAVGDFHTHQQGGPGAQLLSPDDINHIRSTKLPHVVMTPNGNLYFDPTQ